jgi:hypothetical protein
MDQSPSAEEDGAKNEERGAVEAGREGGRISSRVEHLRRDV